MSTQNSGRPVAVPTRRWPFGLVAGTSGVALGVGCGKWGAYLGRPPVYLTDILLTGACVLMLVRGRVFPPKTMPRASARGWPGVAMTAFTGYVLLRFAFAADHSLTAVRDFAPYGYALVAFVSARSFSASPPDALERTSRVIGVVLLFHLAWIVVVELVPSFPDGMPLIDGRQGLHLFSPRGATDATVAGITASVFLMKFLRRGRPHHLLVVAAALWVVVEMGARAALLATAVGLVLTVVLFYAAKRADVSRRGRLLATGFLPLVLLCAATALPYTTTGSKLLAGFGLAQPKSRLDQSAIGTARGRSEAWHLVADYMDRGHNSVLGVGFGPDYLLDSGARVPLGNGPLLRSPHNYLINTWARLGLVGVALVLLSLLVAAREAVRARSVVAGHELVFFATVFPAASFTNALFGVELESPFWAVPFFWCLGILLSRPTHRTPTWKEG